MSNLLTASPTEQYSSPQRWDGNTDRAGDQRTSLQELREPRSPAQLQMALNAALIGGLDRLSHGVALLDASGVAHYANAAARVQLALIASQPPQQSTDALRWQTALRQVCHQGRRELVQMRIAGTTKVVVLTPLRMTDESVAFAVFSREELCGSVELQMFALQYQLTGAETAVLRKLSDGLKPAAIAQAHCVARTTVLTQVAAIRSKTRCSSVRNLLETLARMPPVRPLQTAAAPY